MQSSTPSGKRFISTRKKEGQLTEPVDTFAHPFWDTVRNNVANKAIEIRPGPARRIDAPHGGVSVRGHRGTIEKARRAVHDSEELAGSSRNRLDLMRPLQSEVASGQQPQ